jgi:hypothetical protein
MIGRRQVSGYAVVSLSEAIEYSLLPGSSTLAQKAELFAFTQALQLEANETVSISIDPACACNVVHAHSTIWKERCLLTAQSILMKHVPEIINLPDTFKLPMQVVVIHCQAHQKATGEVSGGNNQVDKQAKEASRLPLQAALLPSPFLPSLQCNSRETEAAMAKTFPGTPEG